MYIILIFKFRIDLLIFSDIYNYSWRQLNKNILNSWLNRLLCDFYVKFWRTNSQQRTITIPIAMRNHTVTEVLCKWTPDRRSVFKSFKSMIPHLHKKTFEMVANWWQDRRMIENYLKNENVEEISAADRSQQQRTEVKNI